MTTNTTVRAAAEGMPVADLCRLYKSQWDAVTEAEHEADEAGKPLSDDEVNRLCDTTFRATLARIIETPIMSADDAVTALEWVMAECDGFAVNLSVPTEGGPYDRAIAHLLSSVRDWIKEKAS